MASITLDLSGDRDLMSKIEALGNGIKAVARTALAEGAAPILRAAKANAPIRTGALQRSLRIQRATSRQGRVRVVVTTGAGDYKGKQFYGAFVEYGHHVGSRRLGSSRRFVPPVHFITRAFQSEQGQATQIIEQKLRVGIEEAVKSL